MAGAGAPLPDGVGDYADVDQGEAEERPEVDEGGGVGQGEVHGEEANEPDDQYVGDWSQQLAVQAPEDFARQSAVTAHDEHQAAGAGLDGDTRSEPAEHADDVGDVGEGVSADGGGQEIAGGVLVGE